MFMAFGCNWHSILREEMHKTPVNPLVVLAARRLMDERDDSPDWIKMLANANINYLDEAVAEICNLEGV